MVVVAAIAGGVLTLTAGQSKRIDIDLPTGSYEFFCDVPGHDDMEGTLVVE
ncbi:MAG: plastocyanin/azurin family copper-binding protein [Actinomycetota bacterium]